MMNNKKLKYGSFAVAFTVMVLAVLILVNFVFAAIAQNKSLYVDMTKEQLYSVSKEADAIYSTLGEKEIEIIFFTEFDKMLNNKTQKLVYEYANKLSEKYDFISVDYIDVIENPTELENRLPGVSKVSFTDVAITNGQDFRKYSVEKFFTIDSETGGVFAFNGEYRFATAFMQLTYESMLACFTVGHGETTSSSYMMTLFKDAGFDVKEIDLMKEDIPEEARVLIVNDPVSDFAGDKDEVNEIEKVRKFLSQRAVLGNLMVFSSAENSLNLTNLNELLWDWGVRFTPAYVEDKENTISSDYQSVIARYPAEDEGAGAGFTKKFREMENPPKTIAKNVTPIEIRWEETHDFITVSSVLKTHDTAIAYSTESGDEVDKGEMNIMTVSTKMTLGDNYEKYYNYVLCAGTSSFVDETYLNGNVYGNTDIIYEVMRAFGKEMVPVDLDFKVFDNESLDVTLKQANGWSVTLTCGIPVIILALGLVMWAKRRHL
ncbi:MAG: Gldg family protein [Clostridia bacterium]|nr:Gldg family protein [Clostridia bacterium]